MSYPPQQPYQPPVVPGPSAQQPQPAPAGPVPQPPAGPSSQTQWIVVSAIAAAAILAIMAASILKLLHPGGGTDSPFTVSVTSCQADSIGIAKVGLSVTNRTSEARSATVKIEYRDGSGARLDTDTAYVRNIAPGDTARADESTILDGTPSGSIACIVTDVS